MAQLCETHNLVLANDGKCVLCRRAQRRFLDLEPRRPSRGDHILTALLGLGLLVAVGMLLWALQLPPPDGSLRHASQGTGDQTPERHHGDLAPDPDESETPLEPAAVLTTDGETTAVDSATGSNHNSGEGDGAHALRKQRQKKALRAAQRAVEDEKRNVAITMYSTAWCTICETSRYYMMGRELAFEEHDIERDPTAAKRMAKLNPARSVPTFVVDGEVLVGFNAWQLEGALEDAARKQLAAQQGVSCGNGPDQNEPGQSEPGKPPQQACPPALTAAARP